MYSWSLTYAHGQMLAFCEHGQCYGKDGVGGDASVPRSQNKQAAFPRTSVLRKNQWRAQKRFPCIWLSSLVVFYKKWLKRWHCWLVTFGTFEPTSNCLPLLVLSKLGAKYIHWKTSNFWHACNRNHTSDYFLEENANSAVHWLPSSYNIEETAI